MVNKYNKENTSTHLMNYHFIWCTKYRKKWLKSNIRKRLMQLIYRQAYILKCKILSLEVMPEHIHLFIQLNPKIKANYIIGRIKGYTSFMLRSEFKWMQIIDTLWTRSYFVSTAGNVSSYIIVKYIQGQYD